jgi:S-formylglutathione hydrolase FrmB
MTRPIPRRAFLAGAGGVTAAAIATAFGVRSGRIPARGIWNDVTGACGDPGPIPPDPEWPVAEGSLRSPTVDGPVRYAVVTPPGLRRRNASLAVLLPGRGGSANDTMTSTGFPGFLAEAMSAGTVEPFALASVDGGASYWHARASGEDRMAMLLRDFLPMLENRYGLARGPVALVGWSMGGYGALLAAQEHPERFVGVAAASPAIFQSYDEMRAGPGDAFDSPEDFAAHDVIADAARLGDMPVRVDCGTADPFYENDRAFVAALPTEPEGSWFRGCHNGDSWRVVAPAQIAFVGRALAASSLSPG